MEPVQCLVRPPITVAGMSSLSLCFLSPREHGGELDTTTPTLPRGMLLSHACRGTPRAESGKNIRSPDPHRLPPRNPELGELNRKRFRYILTVIPYSPGDIGRYSGAPSSRNAC